MAFELRSALLTWYDANARDLPWRRTRDPYAIWVSEVMLQQTRVGTVIPYYERFVARFPTAAALARATEDDLMSMWSGLGYYRRARLLHAGVREVVLRYGGHVPVDAHARRALPGIGRYTSGALGSIAFDRPEPIVDGNVARVLSRLDAIRAPLGSKESDALLWSRAESLVHGPRPGAFNQALMELGATVCTKIAPRCAACPISRACVARRAGEESVLPIARPRAAPKEVAYTAVLARDGRARFWLVREAGELFGGLWSLPMAQGHGRTAAARALETAGVEGRLSGEPTGRVSHVLTHRHMHVELWNATGARARTSEHRKPLTPNELHSVGTATLLAKLLALDAQPHLPPYEPRGRQKTRRTKSTRQPASTTSPKARTLKRI